MTSANILLRNANVLMERPGCMRHGPLDVLIQAGRIAEIGPMLAARDNAEVIDAAGRLIAPGLVNAHWHSPMQLSHGTAD